MMLANEIELAVVFQKCSQRALEKLNLWVSLLPEEYRGGVLGMSWPVILLTAVLGVIICWILMWRSSAAKRIKKEQAYDMNIGELRSQIMKMMKEKLGSENELEDLRVEMTKMNENSKKEKASSLHLLEELELMKQKLGEVDSNYNTSQEELKRASAENLALSRQVKDSEAVLAETKSRNAHLQSSLSASEDRFDKVKQEEENMKKKLKSFERRLSEKEEKEEKQETKLKEAFKKLEDVNELVRKLEDKVAAVSEEKDAAVQEAEVLKDCLLQFQGVQQSVGAEELEGDELVEKQKEVVKNLIDVAEVRKKMKQTEIEKERIQVELQAEKKAREESDVKYVELHAECELRKELQEKAERDAQVNQTKLSVVEEYYAKRDVEMQGKLGKEKTVREMKESELEEECGKKKELNEEVEMFKKRNRDQKKEFQDMEKQLKKEIKDLEKKSHENWIASRQFETKLDVANREVNQLRLEISDLHLQLTMKNRGMSPRPMPRNTSFGGPPMSPPVRMGGRRSPAGSMHSEGHPDRPLHMVDGRPPPDLAPPKSFELGDGLPHRPMAPRRGPTPSDVSPRRPDFDPRGPPQGFPDDGPPPMYGPPPINLSSFRPPMDGPGPLRYLDDVINNSYSGRDRPPMIIDDPMRDRPVSPHRDGPMLQSPFAPRPMPIRAERPLDNHPMVRPSGPYPMRHPSFPPPSDRQGGQPVGQPAPPFTMDDRRTYDQSRRSRPGSRQEHPPPLNNTIPMVRPPNVKQNPLMPLHGNDSCPAEPGV